MTDITILTDDRYINPKKDWYTEQVIIEDELLKQNLTSLGLNVNRKSWSDKSYKWEDTKFAIFRTTWDYFDRYDEFFKWIEKTKMKTKFINSEEIIKWNIDKKYLIELEKKGINIAPTILIKNTEKINLKQLFHTTKWKEAVIKPAISGAAKNTYRVNKENYTEYEKKFNDLIKEESMLFQEFLDDILKNGEISLILIEGKYTHSIKKIAKKGDFRVQDDHGGKVVDYNATHGEINFAKKCLEATDYTPIYARVDIIYDNNNKPSLSELELIEPELWFRNYPQAAKLLAESIYNKYF